MAILTKPVIDGAHWYTRDGKPCHTVLDAKGNERPTQKGDARGLDLVPSVTTCTGIYSKPGINRWREMHIAKAAKLVVRGDSDDASWMRKVREVAEVEMERGREFGTATHHVVEHFLHKGDWPTEAKEEHVHVARKMWEVVRDIMSPTTKVLAIEKVVVDNHVGYGGAIDLILGKGNWTGIVDWKTKTTKGYVIQRPPEYMMQIPAYAHALGLRPNKDEFSLANVLGSNDEPDRPAEMMTYKDHDEIEYWRDSFMLTHAMWCRLNNFEPQQKETK